MSKQLRYECLNFSCIMFCSQMVWKDGQLMYSKPASGRFSCHFFKATCHLPIELLSQCNFFKNYFQILRFFQDTKLISWSSVKLLIGQICMQIRFYIGYDLDENVKMQNSSDCKTFVKKRVHQAYVKKISRRRKVGECFARQKIVGRIDFTVGNCAVMSISVLG